MDDDSIEHFALELVSDGVLITDEDGSVIYANESFRTMMQKCQLSAEDLGLDLLENGDSFVKIFAEVMQGGNDKDTRVTFTNPHGGRYRYFSILRKIIEMQFFLISKFFLSFFNMT